MAEEPAVCVDGFEAAAVGAEDNLSIPLGDFMAFLNTEPAPPEEGREEDEEELQQPAVNQGCLEMPADTNGSEDLFQSQEGIMELAILTYAFAGYKNSFFIILICYLVTL